MPASDLKILGLLSSVDEQDERSQEWIVEVLEILKENDIHHPVDLVGLDSARDINFGSASAGKRAFVKRAIDMANGEQIQNQMLNGPPKSDKMNTLLKALTKEEPIVHVNMHERIQEMRLVGISDACLPKGTLVDSLATEIKKLKKKDVATPFVFEDISKYLPY